MNGIVFTLLLFVNGLIIISSLSVFKFSVVNAADTKSNTTTTRHDSSEDDSGTLLVVESVKFANGSLPTVPPVEIGTVTVSGNNPTPTHFKVAAGDNEEGEE